MGFLKWLGKRLLILVSGALLALILAATAIGWAQATLSGQEFPVVPNLIGAFICGLFFLFGIYLKDQEGK